MVNPSADGYTKTANQRKNAKRRQYEKPIKRILKPRYSLSYVGVVFTFSWPGETNRPSSFPSVTPLQ